MSLLPGSKERPPGYGFDPDLLKLSSNEPFFKPVDLPERFSLNKKDVQAIIIGLGAGGLTGNNISRRQAIAVPTLVTAGYLGTEIAFDNLGLGVFIGNKVEKLGQTLRYGIGKVADVPEGLEREAERFLSQFDPSFFVRSLGDLVANKGLVPDGCAVRIDEENGFLTIQTKDRRNNKSRRMFIANTRNGGTLFELEPPSGYVWAGNSNSQPEAYVEVGYNSETGKLSATVVQTDTLSTTPIHNVYLPIISRNWTGETQPTPTPTEAPPTPDPTPTTEPPQVPEIPWETVWLNEGDGEGWSAILQNGYNGYYTGGLVSVVTDPTGVKGGKVLKCWLTEGFSQWPGDEGQHKRRAQPGMGGDWNNPSIFCNFPVRIGAEMLYNPLLKAGGRKWQNGCSIFGIRWSGGQPQHIIAVNPKESILDLQFINPDGSRTYGIRYPNAPVWQWDGNWRTIDVYIGANGLTILLQSNENEVLKPVAYGYLNLNFVKPGIFGTHWGLYCGTKDPSDDYPTSSDTYMLKKRHWVKKGQTQS